VSQYHGGYLVVQAAIVGGMDRNGNDAVNDLTYLFLDVMEEAGLRDPNYQARVHAGSPAKYVERVAQVARKGNAVPALFGDEAAVASLTAHDCPLEEARGLRVVGCVELALPARASSPPMPASSICPCAWSWHSTRARGSRVAAGLAWLHRIPPPSPPSNT